MNSIFGKCVLAAIIVVLALPLPHLSASRDRIVLRGIVVDVDQIPLGGVEVWIKSMETVAITSERGEFVMVVPEGISTLTLLFEKDGYHRQRLRVNAVKGAKKISVVLIPEEQIQEEISVTATDTKEKAISVPMSESKVSELEIKEKIPENIVATLVNTPGVHFIGKGGYTVTPSIRGLARRRVLLLVDGMRVTSDRRVGSSASFLAPALVERIEVVRSASSVIYGSDAIGGVVQMLTGSDRSLEASTHALNLSYLTNNQRFNAGLAINRRVRDFSLRGGFQYSHAGNYSTPEGEVFHSGYTQYSGLFAVGYHTAQRGFSLGYLGGYGRDIGRPDRDNDPDSYTIVPRDINHMVNLNYVERSLIKNGEMRLLLYINPATYDLKKYDAAAAANEYSDSDAWNMGMRATVEKSLRLPLILRGGVEWFGRRNVTFENRIEPTGDGAENDISHPLTDGTRDDISAFFTLDYTGLPGWDFLAGIRYTWFALSARADDTDHDKEAGSPSYFVGVTRKFGRSVNLFVNIGRAFRMPGLSESFYTGLTGRRYVIGNPDLNPETSFNIEGGFRLFTRKLYAGISLFSHTVNDMIERYKNEDGIYTYDNIQRGIFTGAELEVQYFPIKNVELFGHYFHYRGRSSTENEPLNDVPAPKIFVGGKLYLGQLWAEINYLHSFEKNDPGPAEVENAAYDVINIKGGFYFSSRLSLNLKVANLLNEMYYANPDPDIPPAKGVEFSAGIHYYF